MKCFEGQNSLFSIAKQTVSHSKTNRFPIENRDYAVT